MAMIKCPECGEEISDKAKKCVHCGEVLKEDKIPTKICSECEKEVQIDAGECPYCGCPLDNRSEQVGAITETTKIAQKSKKHMMKIIIPMVVVAVIATISFTIYNKKVITPRNTYNEAVELLEHGEYEKADKMFNSIKGYKDVDEIQGQLKYESYAYSAINNLKKHLKNPDSYQPHDIVFYASMGEEIEPDDTEKATEITNGEKERYPVCIMRYGAQNGFGGNTTGYAIFSYNPEEKGYKILGSCDSLDEADYDRDDEDDKYELLICGIINLYFDGDDTVGSINLNRLKTVLKNDANTTVKIIE